MTEDRSSDNNLDDSLTESDAEDDVNDSDTQEESANSNVEAEKSDDDKVGQQPKDIMDILKENLTKKYQDRQGKQLYIRFPKKVPTDDAELQKQAKALSTLIIKAHMPRQKHARFCLVDFQSKEDRDTALQTMKTAMKSDDAAFKGIIVKIPRTESDEFIQELAERKQKSFENKKAKSQLKKASRLAMRAKNFTSTVVIRNLPKNSSLIELRKLIPNAVDIQIKAKKDKAGLNGSSIAAITLPSTMEARAAVKQKLSLGGTELIIRFDLQKLNKAKNKGRKRKLDKTQITEEKDVGTKIKKKTLNAGRKLKPKLNLTQATEEKAVSSKIEKNTNRKLKRKLDQTQATEENVVEIVKKTKKSNKSSLKV